MSWRDLYIIITTCCSPEDKQWIWKEDHKHVEKLHTWNPNDVGPSAQEVPDQYPKWDYNTAGVRRNKNTMMQCLLAGMKNAIKKPVNYDKFREVTQGKEENPALFHNWLVEAFWKYTNLDPSCLHSQVLIGQHFISQSALIFVESFRNYKWAHKLLWPSW